MMRAIDVYLSAPAGMEVDHKWIDRRSGADVYNIDDDTYCATCGVQAIVERSNNRDRYWLSDAARAARDYAAGIHGAFNHNGSEIQTDYFDVNYYGQVNVCGEGDYHWKAPK